MDTKSVKEARHGIPERAAEKRMRVGYSYFRTAGRHIPDPSLPSQMGKWKLSEAPASYSPPPRLCKLKCTFLKSKADPIHVPNYHSNVL